MKGIYRKLANRYLTIVLIATVFLLLSSSFAMASWFGDAWDAISGAASEVWDAVVDTAEAVADAVVDAAEWVWDQVKELISSIVSFEPGDISRLCSDFNTYKANHNAGSGCWTCQIFMIFFDAGNQIAGKIAGAFSGPGVRVLAVGLLAWIGYHTLVFYSNVAQGGELLQHFTHMGGGLVRGALCVVFLSGGASFIFDSVIAPILSSTANYAMVVSGTKCTVSTGGGSLASGPLSGTRGSMNCMIKAIASGLAEPQAVADALRCAALHWRTFKVNALITSFEIADIPHPMMWLWGCFLQIWYAIIGFMFPLALLDIVFRMGIILGFTPVFVLSWVFPCTRHYCKTGFELFLHCCFGFLISALLLAMMVAMFASAWSMGMTENFMKAMYNKDYINAFDAVWYTHGYKIMILTQVISCYGIHLAPKPDSLASQFVNDSCEGEGVAFKAIHYIIEFIIDIILLVITIISWGATSEMYFYKLADYAQKVKKTTEEINKIKKKEEAIRKKMNEIKRRIRQLQKVQETLRRVKAIAAKG
ncbi:MAG: hypothetical protein MJ247_04300 [Alphaproteobacteria bacterium]|nr:hypothetical protein [Alphaproteobacteria bacterium]